MIRRTPRKALALVAPLLIPACSPAFVGFESACTLAGEPVTLPREVRESSGVVPVTGHSDLFWTHNDSGGTDHLHVVNRRGTLLASVRVAGAAPRDWEEIAAGPCPNGGACLYLADVGDNAEREETVTLYRFPEPEVAVFTTTPTSSVAVAPTGTAPPDAFGLRFPEGPRDVEGVYILPGERIFLVTKGRNHPVEIYRVPPLDPPSEFLLLERIQTLTSSPPFLPRWVTGASATGDGRLVVIRTYETLQFYRTRSDGTLDELPGALVNLRPLQEPQGEAVSFVPEPTPSSEPPTFDLVLTSEAGLGPSGTMAFVRCRAAGFD